MNGVDKTSFVPETTTTDIDRLDSAVDTFYWTIADVQINCIQNFQQMYASHPRPVSANSPANPTRYTNSYCVVTSQNLRTYDVQSDISRTE